LPGYCLLPIGYSVCVTSGSTREIRERRRPRLSEEAADHVRELIISGQLRPGSFVRPESIAEELAISTTPAREGMLALLGEGFLRLEPRRGFVVAPLSAKDICDVFCAQALLAGELAARAAAVMDPKMVAPLDAIQAELEQAARRHLLDEVERLNFEFHRYINVAANAPKISWFLRATVRYAPRRYYPVIGGWMQATVRDHRLLLKALKAGDADAARAHMQEHVESAGRLLAAHMDTTSLPPATSA
jgi:DNA-binding GntR family transcriptional regulator